MLKLIIEDDEGRKTVVPFVRDEITIGRQEGNTIRLTERNVSRRHARLLKQNAHVLIEDLGSYNGIKVNGDRITGQVQVQDGDLIQIGDYDLAIQREEDGRPAATIPLEPSRPHAPITAKLPEHFPTQPLLPIVPEPSAESTRPLPDSAPVEEPRHLTTSVIRVDQVEASRPQRAVVNLDASDAPRFVVLNTEFAGRAFVCSKTELRVGRADDNDISIDHRSLSRTHCKVVREDTGEWKVIDLQSANGLMVNGETYAQATLRSGDTLELGHLKMKFVGPGDATPSLSPSMAAAAPQAPAPARETPRPSSSKTPVIAVVMTLLVLVIGAGGYALYKSATDNTQKVTTITPTKPEKPKNDDSKSKGEDAKNAGLISAAQKAMAEGDLPVAESSLLECKTGDDVCPEAKPLLAKLENEKRYLDDLQAAADALERSDFERAALHLQNSRPTEIFKTRHRELDAERQKAVVSAQKKAAVPSADESAERQKTVERLLEEARELKKKGSYKSAIDVLKKCQVIDRRNPDCTVLLASVFATRGGEEESESDTKEARRLYEEFLKIAPAGDKRIARVQAILAGKQ